MTSAGAVFGEPRIFARSHRLRRRVLFFALCSAIVGLLLGVLIFCFTNVYIPLGQLRERNQATLGRIQCEAKVCDISAIANDWEFSALTGVMGYVSATTFLRKYFLFGQTRPHSVDEALKLGEGESVEFKRSISFESANSVEQVLQSVAAFANSGDGTVFIGIENEGQIKGITAIGPKEKDQLSQRIYQLVRQRIKPMPAIRVDFVDVKGFTVCTIFVPRGEEPLHFLDGVIYVRYGSADIKAQPEIVKRLLTAHAF